MSDKRIFTLSMAAGLAVLFTLTGCAPVTLSSKPEQAKVYRKKNDKLIGTTPVTMNMIAGSKEVVFRKAGYFSKTVVVSPLDSANRTIRLAECNRVLLLSEPRGAEMFVDNERVGKTPYLIDYNNTLRTVELRAPGYISQTVTFPEDPEDNVKVTLEREGSILVESNPKKAIVFNSRGERLGVTPLPLTAPEETIFELHKEGYYTQKITVGPDTANPFVVTLEREPIIIVQSEPTGAVVVHRGVTLGITPFRQLAKKDMDLKIHMDRYYEEHLSIAPDSPRKVKVQLKPKPYVLINSKPEGAQLYRSGGVELVGKTPVEILVEKDVALEIHKEGFDIKPFVLSPDSSGQVTVPLMRSVHEFEKTVMIDSNPKGALVFRPGGAELIGKTPLEQTVRAERNFELQLEGFITKIVTVSPDSAETLVFALARDESARNATICDPLLNTPSSF